MGYENTEKYFRSTSRTITHYTGWIHYYLLRIQKKKENWFLSFKVCVKSSNLGRCRVKKTALPNTTKPFPKRAPSSVNTFELTLPTYSIKILYNVAVILQPFGVRFMSRCWWTEPSSCSSRNGPAVAIWRPSPPVAAAISAPSPALGLRNLQKKTAHYALFDKRINCDFQFWSL